MRRCHGLILLSWLMANVSFSQSLVEGFSASQVVTGLNPVAMAIDHHHRQWLVEKDGRVLIVEEDGQVLPDPFITLEVDDFNERGLLGIALHPDMDRQPFVYLYYTVPNGKHNRVSRFIANGDLAVPGSEEILLELDELSGAIHNGGAMLFDNNGYLFIATGEAGQPSNSQDTANLLGKILRIGADGMIPQDNPFYEKLKGQNRAIWSMGHRNPFNLAYDTEEDLLYATDVGGGEFEEINLIMAGKNYGYPLIEGPIKDQIPPDNYQDPFFSYAYDVGSDCSIVGLAVYRSAQLSFGEEFDGAIFFADYCGGYIKYLEKGNPGIVKEFASELNRPLNVTIDPTSGDLFFQTRAGQGGGSPEDNTASENGELWQLFFKGNGSPEIITSLPDDTKVIGEDIVYHLEAIGADELIYTWHINGVGVAQENASSLQIENLSIDQNGISIKCIVENAEGSDTSNIATLRVLDNSRPLLNILTPIHGDQFRAGDTLFFGGQGTDQEDGALPASNLKWKIDLHHNDHTHPLETLEGLSEGHIVVPTNGETDDNVWIRIHLEGTDEDGLQNGTFVEIYPEFSTITLQANIPASVNIDGASRSLPVTFNSLIGLNRTIEIPEIQQTDKRLVLYRGWSDGWTDNLRNFQTSDQSDTFQILFDEVSLGNGTGLLGEYWNGEDLPSNERPPDLIRLDSTLDFGWDNKSPSKDVIDRDFFFARWQGFIEPSFSEKYTLSIASDDGARMWINDELIFEHWNPQATTEHFFPYTFNAGEKYEIRIEYFERDGGAAIHLRWESEHTKRAIIPKSQLYPLQFGNLSGVVWLDREKDASFDGNEQTVPSASVILLDNFYRFVEHQVTMVNGQFAFDNQSVGQYYMHIILPEEYRDWAPGKGLDGSFYSDLITVGPDSNLQLEFGLLEEISTSLHQEQLLNLAISPNPVEGWVNISAPGQIMDLRIIDKLGIEQTMGWLSPTSNLHLNLAHLTAGAYFIKAKVDNKTVIRRIIKL